MTVEKRSIEAKRQLRFGVFEVDLQAGEVRRQGVKIKLQDKPFQLLLLLLDRAGRIATREELRRRLWPADTFVDFDANFKTTLSKLRQALGDSAENPIFIETIPRQGYRFLAPVVSTRDEHVSSVSEPGREADSPIVSAAAASALTHGRHSFWRVAVGLLVLAAVSFVFYLERPRPVAVATSGAQRVTLLVLPFDNLSGDSTKEYFSDGLTDEMITLLGHQYSEGLAVIARTSAMRYKGTHQSLPQIARELGVQYVLEGSVRRSSNHVAINAQLFRAQDQASLWAETYESEVRDMLDVQHDVSARIARSVIPQLIPWPQGTASVAPDPRVHDAYLMGLYETNKRTAEGLRKSLEYYRKAIYIDSTYAPAHAGLANSYLLSAGWLMLKPADAYPKAKAAALRALELDDNLAEAHTTIAVAEHEYDWKWSDAEREFRRAIELNSNSAIAHKSYAEFLMHGGRNAEAIAEMERARDLDPLSLIVNSLVGFVYLNAGQYDRAVAECEKVVQLDPRFAPAHYFLGGALLRERRYAEAIAQFQIARDLTQGTSLMAAALARAYAVAGRPEQALRVLNELQQNAKHNYVSPYGLAQVYAELGDKDRAVKVLQRAGNEHAVELMFLGIDHSFDGLRQEPQFQELLRGIGFPHRSRMMDPDPSNF